MFDIATRIFVLTKNSDDLRISSLLHFAQSEHKMLEIRDACINVTRRMHEMRARCHESKENRSVVREARS